MTTDGDDLMPTPVEDQIFLKAILNPKVAAGVLGVPFAIAFYFVGPLLFAGANPVATAVTGWLAGVAVALFHLSKPY